MSPSRRSSLALLSALWLPLLACGSSGSTAAIAGFGVSTTGGGGAVGGSGSAGRLANGGATTGGSSAGGSAAGEGTSGSGGGGVTGTGSTAPIATMLEGSLAFEPAFLGEFYGLLPDGGPDLSNLDCRISDGLALAQDCDTPRGPSNITLIGRHILDLYVTSAAQLDLGNATVSAYAPSADGGAFATIDLTLLSVDGGRAVITASSGTVTYEANAQGMSGQFTAYFLLGDGDGGTLSGTFGAPYCALLGGY